MNCFSPSKGISHTHTHTEFQLLEKKTGRLLYFKLRTSYIVHSLLAKLLVSYQPGFKSTE